MPVYTCERCLKEFKQKSHLQTHMNRKTPCQEVGVKKELEEIKNEISDIKLKMECKKNIRVKQTNNMEDLCKSVSAITVTEKNDNVENLNIVNKQEQNVKKNKQICDKNTPKSLKPIIKWSGGKKDELREIIPHIPDKFLVYIEPFVGGGAVYFHLNPNHAVINDVHKELIDFYQSIKNGNAPKIYDFMQKHPNDEATYYKVRGYDNTDVLDNAKRFYYLRKTCFRGMLRYNKSGEFNIPFGRYKTLNFEELKNKDYEDLLKRTDIYNKSFELIFRENNSPNNFMFLDPPYDSEFTDYGYCTFGKDEHQKF